MRFGEAYTHDYMLGFVLDVVDDWTANGRPGLFRVADDQSEPDVPVRRIMDSWNASTSTTPEPRERPSAGRMARERTFVLIGLYKHAVCTDRLRDEPTSVHGAMLPTREPTIPRLISISPSDLGPRTLHCLSIGNALLDLLKMFDKNDTKFVEIG